MTHRQPQQAYRSKMNARQKACTGMQTDAGGTMGTKTDTQPQGQKRLETPKAPTEPCSSLEKARNALERERNRENKSVV